VFQMLHFIRVSTKNGRTKDTRADRFRIDKTTTLKLKFCTLCRHKRSRGMAPFILTRSTRWRRVIKFRPRTLYSWEAITVPVWMGTRVTLHVLGKWNNLLPLPGFEKHIVQPVDIGTVGTSYINTLLQVMVIVQGTAEIVN